MTFALRPYQSTMIDECRSLLKRHRSVMLQLPTGGGKTAMGAFMAGTAAGRGMRVWFCCHRDFLIAQTRSAFRDAGIRAGVIAAGHPISPFEPVHVCSIPTLTRRLAKLKPPDFMIVDEAHHSEAKTWKKIIAWFREGGGSRMVGLSATPARLDGRGLDDCYDAMVAGPSVSWLMEAGFLSRYRAYAPSTPDMQGVHTRAGDYARDETEAVMDRPSIVGDIIGHYRRLALGKRAIYFAVSVRASEHLAAMFNTAGVAARHLDAGSSADERRGAANDLAEGRLAVLVNVDLFGEGYDLSQQAGREVPVEAVGLARPTQSLVLHLQQIGRSLRPKPEPAAILDHAGNLMRHGLPDDDRVWTLAGVEKPAKKGEQAAPVRQCPECYGVHRVAPACVYCGFVYPIASREVEHVEGDLEEIDKEMIRRARKTEEWRCKTVDELSALGQARGYRHARQWAEHVMRARARKKEMVA